MPTLPSLHGCSPIQAIVSAPSVGSSAPTRNSPFDRNMPRQSCQRTQNPASTRLVVLGRNAIWGKKFLP